ncbi:hypothetical protein [Spiroplasma sp. SV19]|uniref:hypothetical protein n=1 Tax=Spiroplasma sp. SV19 TaxID=2570468 RepID=UPI0024B75EED|nr:hypothetical protein [Spiroplasma sp. SV19]WHQ37395.1 hypothetical protein E7Y35_05985 [Spiroplasma sp. SV19]
MKKTSIFLVLGSILIIIIGISMFVTIKELFTRAVFFIIAGGIGINGIIQDDKVVIDFIL